MTPRERQFRRGGVVPCVCAGVIVGLAAMLSFAAAARAQVSYEVLHAFDCAQGCTPIAGLVQASDGNFYGTTSDGGVGGGGTVFKVTPTGAFTTLHSFACSGVQGCQPSAALVQARDGNLYGTTVAGGASGVGTVFKITPTGTFTTLHSFVCSEGCYPWAGLIQASDGNFYGTTWQGGAAGRGTVFKLTLVGTLITLYSYTCGSDGCYPYAGLIQASDGNLYGTTTGGGTNPLFQSTVFKITPSGTLTTLHSFDCTTEGCASWAGLIQAGGGNFYGTTHGGGAGGFGTVFELASSGTITTLHSFDCATEGCYPWAGLIQARRFTQRLGSFYGTAAWGGPAGGGAVFRLTPTGTFATVYSFTYGSNSDGFYPYAGLTQARDGKLYGTTASGGSSGGGVIFRLSP